MKHTFVPGHRGVARATLRGVLYSIVTCAVLVVANRADAHDLGIPLPHIAMGHAIAFEPARRLALVGAVSTSGLSSLSSVDAILCQASVYTSTFDLESKIVPEGELVFGSVLFAYRRYHRISRRVEWYGTLWLGGGAVAQGLRGNQHLASPMLMVSGDIGLRLANAIVIAAQGSYFAPLSGAPLGLTVQFGYP